MEKNKQIFLYKKKYHPGIINPKKKMKRRRRIVKVKRRKRIKTTTTTTTVDDYDAYEKDSVIENKETIVDNWKPQHSMGNTFNYPYESSSSSSSSEWWESEETDKRYSNYNNENYLGENYLDKPYVSKFKEYPNYIKNEDEFQGRKNEYMNLLFESNEVEQPKIQPKARLPDVTISEQYNFQSIEYKVDPIDFIYDITSKVRDIFVTKFELLRKKNAKRVINSSIAANFCYNQKMGIVFDRYWDEKIDGRIYFEVRGKNIDIFYRLLDSLERRFEMELGTISEKKIAGGEGFFFSVMLLKKTLNTLLDKMMLTKDMINKNGKLTLAQSHIIKQVRGMIKCEFSGFRFTKFLCHWDYDELFVNQIKKRWVVFYFSTPIDMENAKDEIYKHVYGKNRNDPKQNSSDDDDTELDRYKDIDFFENVIF